MKECSAYSQGKPPHELPAMPKNVECSVDYELVGESESVYEKIPGDL